MATTGQITLINKLVSERADLYRQIGEAAAADAIMAYPETHDIASLAFSDASSAITKMIAFNREFKDTHRVVAGGVARITEDGMYRLDGVIYKVQEARNGSGRLYAKRLNTFQIDVNADGEPVYKSEFEYAPGIVTKLTNANRMTLDEAKEFGALYGNCCACGRDLTNELSIELGIGPVCRSKF